MKVVQDPKQRVVEQHATNAQTLQSVADREAEIAGSADELAKQRPEISELGALAREHQRSLMEIAAEERNLATAIQTGGAPLDQVAANQREHGQDLVELARREGDLAAAWQRATSDDPAIGTLVEQSERNRQLLRQVAHSEAVANRTLRQENGAAEPRNPDYQ